VGAGNWATYAHVPALQLLPNYRITAVATRHQESAKKYAQHHRIPYAFGNYEEMVQHPEVDLVAVLTIAPQHEAVVRSAIAAG
jgi:predicted dehydrogenase